MLRRVYSWAIHWAATPYSALALGLIAAVESSVFPIPPDVLLIAMTLAKPKAWFRYALIATICSVAGGLIGYLLGWYLWQNLSPFFYGHVFSEAAFLKVQDIYNRFDFWAVFVSGFTPIPYKVFTILAGVCGIRLDVFLLASLLGRGGRFFLVAAILGHFGNHARAFIEKYFDLLSYLFVILLIAGFFLIKLLR